MKGENKLIKPKKRNKSEILKKLQDDKNKLIKTETYVTTGKQDEKKIMKNYSLKEELQSDSNDDDNMKKEIIVKKNISSKNVRKNTKLLNKKVQRNSLDEINDEEIQENKKKTKSDGDKKYKKEPKFFLENIKDFQKTYEKWKRIKSIKIDKEGIVTEKLKNDELILDKCKEIAVNKLKELKDNLILDNIYYILSYDNTNPSLLYNCFRNIKDKTKLNELISEYKYCFSDINEIIDYFDKDKIENINLNKEFNHKFIFKDIDEGIRTLKNTIIDLLDLIAKERSYTYELNNKTDNKQDKKKKKIISFIYNYDNQNNLILNEKEKRNELLNLGKKWLQNYMKIRDFNNFEVNQPYTYENNKILYITFCIFEIYNPLVDIDENKKIITIKNKDFDLVRKVSRLLRNLITHLDEKNIDAEFQYKIRFFGVFFETETANFSNVETKYMKHIINKNEKITKKDFDDFEISKKNKDKEDLIKRKYTFSNDILKVEEAEGTIEFKISEYDRSLINDLLDNKQILNLTWEKNDLKSFQGNNFLTHDDITFLKETIRNIFKSKFWDEIFEKYCEHDFLEGNPFKRDEFIDQFFKKIIFLPFDIDDMGLFGYTAADNLYVFISGYPYMKDDYDMHNYRANRIIQLGISVIIILHESIHYFKRLIYFLTCQMVERKTIIEDERSEGGKLLEEILFGKKIRSNTKIKVYVKTAFNLLNSNLYEKNLDEIHRILSRRRKKKEEKNKEENPLEESELLKKYKEKLDLSESDKYETFLKENKNKFANASKDFYNEKYVVNYFSSDHRHFKK